MADDVITAGGAHVGEKKTIDVLVTRYYWPGMKEDVKRWVMCCFMVVAECL